MNDYVDWFKMSMPTIPGAFPTSQNVFEQLFTLLENLDGYSEFLEKHSAHFSHPS